MLSVTSVIDAKPVPVLFSTPVFHTSPRMALSQRCRPSRTDPCPTLHGPVGDTAMSGAAGRVHLGLRRTPDVAATATGDRLARLELRSGRFVRLNAGSHRHRMFAVGPLSTGYSCCHLSPFLPRRRCSSCSSSLYSSHTRVSNIFIIQTDYDRFNIFIPSLAALSTGSILFSGCP